jgi:MFS family permease
VRSGQYGSMRGSNEETSLSSGNKEKDVSWPVKVWNKRVVGFIAALAIFTYHSMSYDHLMPIFFEDDRVSALVGQDVGIFPFYSPGGLGLSLRAVGMIMAVNGVIALIVQAVIFPIAAERVGVYNLFLIVTVLHPIAYFIVPFLLIVPETLLYPAIYTCLAVRNVLSIIVYPLLLILIKEATPTASALGKVNGLAASVGAACRMIAPPIAGFLYAYGRKMDCTAIAWYGSVIVAIAGSFQCFSVPRKHNAVACEESATVPRKQNPAVTVTEVSDDS